MGANIWFWLIYVLVGIFGILFSQRHHVAPRCPAPASATPAFAVAP